MRVRLCVFLGVGHCGYGAEAEEGADGPESLGPSAGGLPEPPVQRLLSDHQGEWRCWYRACLVCSRFSHNQPRAATLSILFHQLLYILLLKTSVSFRVIADVCYHSISALSPVS